MRYVLARFDEEAREEAYRIYVTDALKFLFGNNAMRYADILNPAPVETRTGDGIVSDISGKLAALGGEEHNGDDCI